jgi:TRAP-type C4-dicarboxylate transport system substrate-binding protein
MIAKTYLTIRRRVVLASILTLSLGFGLATTFDQTYAADARVLKYATLDPPNSILGRGEDWYLKRIEELSKGRIKFERHWSGSLVPPKQSLEALSSGVVDVSFLIAQWHPDKLPLLTIQTLPTEYRDPWIVGKAFYDFAQKDYAQKELAKQNAVFLISIPLPTYNLLLKKPVHDLSDLKGLKIWASGEQADMMKALGAVPVTIPTPEVYTALERGTLDGAAYPPLLIVDFGMQAAANYLWRLPLGMKASMLAINQNVWNSLSPDLKEIMRKAADDTLKYDAAYDEIVQQQGNEKEAMDKIRKAGVTVADAPDSAKAKVKSLSAPLWDSWIKKMDKAGLPGKQAAADYRALLEKYAGKVPKK